MKEDKERLKKIKYDLCYEYGISTSNRWLDKYIFYFAKCIAPLEILKTKDAIDYIESHMEQFAYFIYGMRAEYTYETNRL